jgi:hypothetical protein
MEGGSHRAALRSVVVPWVRGCSVAARLPRSRRRRRMIPALLWLLRLLWLLLWLLLLRLRLLRLLLGTRQVRKPIASSLHQPQSSLEFQGSHFA